MKPLNSDRSLWNAATPGRSADDSATMVRSSAPACCWFFGCCWYWGDGSVAGGADDIMAAVK